MVIEPEIDHLLTKVDSKYTLCTIASRRARQINDMVHGVHDQALLSMAATPQIVQYTRTKPLTLALEEIDGGDIAYEREGEKK
jgi:DNA-directed RNA polymerase subunit omega